jgi:hypothetical protein
MKIGLIPNTWVKKRRLSGGYEANFSKVLMDPREKDKEKELVEWGAWRKRSHSA